MPLPPSAAAAAPASSALLQSATSLHNRPRSKAQSVPRLRASCTAPILSISNESKKQDAHEHVPSESLCGWPWSAYSILMHADVVWSECKLAHQCKKRESFGTSRDGHALLYCFCRPAQQCMICFALRAFLYSSSSVRLAKPKCANGSPLPTQVPTALEWVALHALGLLLTHLQLLLTRCAG